MGNCQIASNTVTLNFATAVDYLSIFLSLFFNGIVMMTTAGVDGPNCHSSLQMGFHVLSMSSSLR